MAQQHNDEQSAPGPEGIVGLNIRERATSKSPILGILPRDAVIDIGEKSGDQKWARIAKIVDGGIAPAQKGGSVPNEARQGWVFLGELEQETGIPERFDQTYVLPRPYPIKAGELIGHLGEYQRPCEASRLPPQPSRPLLHLEIFSGDDVPAFIEASRKRAAQLADSDKTLFVVETGATLCSPAEPDQMLAADAGVMPLKGEAAGKGPWVQVRPMRTQIIERAGLTFSTKDGPHGSYMVGGQRAYFTGRFFGATNQEMTDDEGVAREKGYGRREVQIPETTSLWIERRHLGRPGGAPAWQQFPLQLSKTMPSASGQPRTLTKAELSRFDESRKAVDDQGFTWWQVDVGDANGRAVRGWVREKGHPKTGWKSPWDWPGFVTEAETAAPADLMRCQLHRLDAAQNAQEANEFKTAAAHVSEGPLLTQLREILDAQDQKDGLISSQDLRKALQTPWLAERLGKLIIRHESEWGGTAAKWDAMDELMLDGLPDWQAEKQRIEKLKIWDGLQGVEGFPASSNVYHFHPVGLLSNLCVADDCAARFARVAAIILRHEGGYVNNPADRGGATNKGISWATWQAYATVDVGVPPSLDNLKALTDEQAKKIYLNRYWKPRGFCGISNEKTALMIYDWTITSGHAIREIKKVLNENFKGSFAINETMDDLMINAINDQNQGDLVDKIGASRKSYYTKLTIKDPTQIQFLKGWLARVDDCLAFRP